MNDRLKFKVWDKKNKKFNSENFYIDCDGDLFFDSWDDGLVEAGRNYKVVQCTGLKDKNDKLIFEGDIIEVQYVEAQIPLFKNKYCRQPENERFEVFCHKDWLKFYAKNDHYRKTCEIHSLDLEKIRTNACNKVYEVIGNIYENRGLLRGEK